MQLGYITHPSQVKATSMARAIDVSGCRLEKYARVFSIELQRQRAMIDMSARYSSNTPLLDAVNNRSIAKAVSSADVQLAR
jgi:hypothetical protein